MELLYTTIGGLKIEYRQIGASNPGGPVLVFLHEGLGSAALWKDFPDRLSAATGLGAVIYSRAGYGGSSPVALPRPLDYMQQEAENFLPRLLDHFAIEKAILIGHSDGASIALVHAGLAANRARILALIVEAPHVFCEDLSIAGIEAAKQAYDNGNLRPRLEKYHGPNVDVAFRGWNDAWLDPAFRHWNIEEYLPGITAPVLAVQGRDDAYGTLVQLAAIKRGVRGHYSQLVLDDCGHAPHMEQAEQTLDAMTDFISALASSGN